MIEKTGKVDIFFSNYMDWCKFRITFEKIDNDLSPNMNDYSMSLYMHDFVLEYIINLDAV